MTQSTKERAITGIIVGVIMIIIQFGFTAFSGRWSKGAKSNDFVKKTVYITDRTTDKEAILKKAFSYTDGCVKTYSESHAKEHDIIDLKIENVEEIQAIQINNIEKGIQAINDWIDKQD